MSKKKKKHETTAHDLVKPTVEGLVERIQAASVRVKSDRDDAEGVHDFRVGLRRLRTVLRASRDLYGKKRMKELEASFKRFGDATNALRDAEVLAHTVAATELGEECRAAAEAWLTKRRDAAEGLRDEAIAVLETDELATAFAALRKSVHERPKKDLPASRFAKSRLKEARAGVSELLPVSREDVPGLHRLRIRFKRLRYTAEMLDRFMTAANKRARKADKVPYGAVAKHASRMQKELGLLHDADVALDTVVDDFADFSPAHREALTEALTVLRHQLVDRSVSRLEAIPKDVLG